MKTKKVNYGKLLSMILTMVMLVSVVTALPSKKAKATTTALESTKVVEVTTYAQLKDKLENSPTLTCVRLANDIFGDFTETQFASNGVINISGGKNIFLDMNGHDVVVKTEGGNSLINVSGTGTKLVGLCDDTRGVVVFDNGGNYNSSGIGMTAVMTVTNGASFECYGRFALSLGLIEKKSDGKYYLDDRKFTEANSSKTSATLVYTNNAGSVIIDSSVRWDNYYCYLMSNDAKRTSGNFCFYLKGTLTKIDIISMKYTGYGYYMSSQGTTNIKFYKLQVELESYKDASGNYPGNKVLYVKDHPDDKWSKYVADTTNGKIKYFSSANGYGGLLEHDINDLKVTEGWNDTSFESEYDKNITTSTIRVIIPDTQFDANDGKHFVANDGTLSVCGNKGNMGKHVWEKNEIKSVDSTYTEAGTLVYECKVCHHEKQKTEPKKIKPSYTITLDANGGTVTPASVKTNNETDRATLPTPERSGYTFDGWYSAKEGGELRTSSTVWSGDTTIYAHWTKKAESELTSIESFTVTGIEDKTYTGSAITQKITVTDAKSKALVENTDFTVAYKNNVEAGEATVTITGTGDYKGTITKTFKITKAAVTTQPVTTTTAPATTTTAPTEEVTVKGVTLKKLVKGKKSLVVKWSKNADADGYEIQYATSKNFKKNAKTVTIKKNKTVSKTIKKLKSGKKYYVRVRAYKTVNDEVKYSKWSKSKSAKTK
jgi:uncharacterized repeat protein (TIGR02543 family)